jgi:hypothetical protein
LAARRQIWLAVDRVAALDLMTWLDLGVELGAEGITIFVIHSHTRKMTTEASAP